MNKGVHALWPNQVLINNINNKELLENFTNSVLQDSDLDKPFNAMQDICMFKDGSKIFKQFRDKIVLPAFDDYLDLIGIDIVNLSSCPRNLKQSAISIFFTHTPYTFQTVTYS